MGSKDVKRAAVAEFSNEQLRGLLPALAELGNGRFDLIHNDRVLSQPYKLGELRMPVTRNLRKVRIAVEDFNEARTGLIREISGGDDRIEVKDRARQKQFAEAEAKLLKQKVTLDLERIRIADLNVGDGDGQNPIPASVIDMLAPIAEDL